MRNTMKNYMLGMTLVAGLFGTGVVAANAAPQEFHSRGERGSERGFDRGNGRSYDRPEVRRDFARREFVRPIGRPVYGGGYGVEYADTYIPPCPGDGYFWTAGYYNDRYWVPGAWTFRGRVGFDRGYAYGRDYRDNRFVAERHEDRHFDRDGRVEGGFRGRR
jgi:hypothetical protein